MRGCESGGRTALSITEVRMRSEGVKNGMRVEVRREDVKLVNAQHYL